MSLALRLNVSLRLWPLKTEAAVRRLLSLVPTKDALLLGGCDPTMWSIAALCLVAVLLITGKLIDWRYRWSPEWRLSPRPLRPVSALWPVLSSLDGHEHPESTGSHEIHGFKPLNALRNARSRNLGVCS